AERPPSGALGPRVQRGQRGDARDEIRGGLDLGHRVEPGVELGRLCPALPRDLRALEQLRERLAQGFGPAFLAAAVDLEQALERGLVESFLRAHASLPSRALNSASFSRSSRLPRAKSD